MKFISQENRAQVGIGTLIVFIAMVLVAAIAAGVLVNTAGLLQETAEQTGAESQAQVSDRLMVSSSYGGVVADTNTNGEAEVGTLSFVVMQSAGSGDINLDDTTVQYIGPDGAFDLVLDESETFVDINPYTGDADNVLEGTAERAVITLTLGGTSPAPTNLLEAGDEATIRFTTSSGATTIVKIQIPSNIEAGDTIAL